MTVNGKADIIDFTITKGDGASAVDPDALVLGKNAIAVDGVAREMTFTATEAGTYILATGEGETNAMIKQWFGSYYKGILFGSGSVEITLEAGQSIKFTVNSNDRAVDTIDLVLSKKDTSAPAPTAAPVKEENLF